MYNIQGGDILVMVDMFSKFSILLWPSNHQIQELSGLERQKNKHRYILTDKDIDIEINVEIVSWLLDILVNYIFLKFYNDTFSSNCLTEK